MRNHSHGGGCGSLREAMRRGARESVAFARRRSGGVWLLPQCKRFPVGGESSTLKQGDKFFVGLWLLFVLSHSASRKRKIPVATIGRSLSGGVTGGIVPNIIFGRKGVSRQNWTFTDILLSSPVLCGQPSILNCIIQDRSCLKEATEEFNGEAKLFVLGAGPVRVDAAC